MGNATAIKKIAERDFYVYKIGRVPLDIAKYYNGDWEPDWNNQDEYKYFIICNRGTYKVDHGWTSICSNIYFKNKKDAQAVIDNPNFRSILDAIYKN